MSLMEESEETSDDRQGNAYSLRRNMPDTAATHAWNPNDVQVTWVPEIPEEGKAARAAGVRPHPAAPREGSESLRMSGRVRACRNPPQWGQRTERCRVAGAACRHSQTPAMTDPLAVGSHIFMDIVGRDDPACPRPVRCVACEDVRRDRAQSSWFWSVTWPMDRGGARFRGV